MIYQVFQLEDPSMPGPPGLISAMRKVQPGIESQGAVCWGTFGHLLGLATNQIYLVTCGEKKLALDLPDHINLLKTWTLSPTIRPTSHTPADLPGVYVFRWFRITPGTEDEIVQLSGEAWPTFESSFDTCIQGLFVEQVPEPTTMLLITWYRDLSVWEASRHPPADARDNFTRRHKLTLNALPIATTLMGLAETGLVSHT